MPTPEAILTEAEHAATAAVLSEELQTELKTFIGKLDNTIADRYHFTSILGGLAKALHDQQAELDERMERDSEFTLVGDFVAAFGLIAAPLTGGASMVFALGAQMAGTALAVFGGIKGNKDGREYQLTTDEFIGNVKTEIQKHSTSLKDVAQAYQDLQQKIEEAHERAQAQSSEPIDPEFFRRLLMFVHAMPGAEKQSFSEFFLDPSRRISNIDMMIDGVKFVHTSVSYLWSFKKFKETVRNAKVITKFNKPNARYTLPQGESEPLLGRVTQTEAESERMANSLLEWDALNPGIMNQLAQRVTVLKAGEEAAAHWAAIGLTTISAGVSAFILAIDLKTAIEIENRIKNQSWSEAALEIQRIRMRAEAQLQDLMRLRGAFDMGLFAEPYVYLHHMATSKYLTIHQQTTINGTYTYLDITDSELHLNNPMLQFSGLPVPESQKQNKSTPFGYMYHRLTGQQVFARERFRRSPATMILWPPSGRPSTSKYRFEITQGDDIGWINLQCDDRSLNGLGIITDGIIRGGLSAEVRPRRYSEDATGAKKTKQTKERRFQVIRGANAAQLHKQNYGILKCQDRYLSWNIRRQQFEMTAQKPDELGAFSMAGNRCIQHRFSLNCLRPDKNAFDTSGLRYVVADDRPHPDCQWRWGTQGERQMFWEGDSNYDPAEWQLIIHIDTGLYLSMHQDRLVLADKQMEIIFGRPDDPKFRPQFIWANWKMEPLITQT